MPASALPLPPPGSVALRVPGLAGSLLPPTMQVSSQLVSQGHHRAAMAQNSAASTCSLHAVGNACLVSDGLHAVREKTGCVTTISFPAVIIEDEEKGSSDYPFNKNFQFCGSSRQTELQLETMSMPLCVPRFEATEQVSLKRRRHYGQGDCHRA